MVPGSRVNHAASSPALIEVQVYHFSGTQTVVFASFSGNREEDRQQSGSSAVVVDYHREGDIGAGLVHSTRVGGLCH